MYAIDLTTGFRNGRCETRNADPGEDHVTEEPANPKPLEPGTRVDHCRGIEPSSCLRVDVHPAFRTKLLRASPTSLHNQLGEIWIGRGIASLNVA